MQVRWLLLSSGSRSVHWEILKHSKGTCQTENSPFKTHRERLTTNTFQKTSTIPYFRQVSHSSTKSAFEPHCKTQTFLLSPRQSSDSIPSQTLIVLPLDHLLTANLSQFWIETPLDDSKDLLIDAVGFGRGGGMVFQASV